MQRKATSSEPGSPLLLHFTQCFVISGITASKQVWLPSFPAYLCIFSSLGAMWLTQAVKDFCACAHNPVEHLPDLALERVEPFLDGFAQLR